MKKIKKTILSISCCVLIAITAITAISATQTSQTIKVSGGSMTMYAKGPGIGIGGWSATFAGVLDSYVGAKAAGVNKISQSETVFAFGATAQLYKLDYNYVQHKLGKGAFLVAK